MASHIVHPAVSQAPVLGNSTWKSTDVNDTQAVISHIQQMLEQLCSRGINSILVTVGPFGEIGMHGSQKGQLFLKENADIGDRFAKMCTDLMQMALQQESMDGDHKQEENEYLSSYDTDTDSDEYIDSETAKDFTSRSLKKENTRVDTEEGSNTDTETPGQTPEKSSASIKEFKSETKNTRLRIKIEPSGITVEKSPKRKATSPKKVEIKTKGVSLLNEMISVGKNTNSSVKPIHSTTKRAKISTMEVTSQKEIATQKTEGLSKSRVFTCRRCGEPFPTTSAHNKHLRSKMCFIRNTYDTPKGRFPCTQCSMVFTRQDYLDVHKSVHEEVVPQNFKVKQFEVNGMIDEIEDDSGEKIQCRVCGQNFLEKRIVLHHLILHHGSSYVCTECDEECDTKQKCWVHQRIHKEKGKGTNTKSSRKMKCRFCEQTFEGKSSLDRHYLTSHADSKVQSFPCDRCKKVFSTQDFLEKHQENIHIRAFVCPHAGCDKGFRSLERLNDHQAFHDDKNFICNICGKLFSTRNNFHNHLAVHNTERRFECDTCEKSFKTRDVLMKHKRIHSSTRLYCCDICGWGFNQAGALRKHVDAHNNVKRHSCDICSQKFTNKASLTNHKLLKNHFNPDDKKSMEDISKSRKCEFCEKRFPPGSAYMYRRHLRIHTGTKPYTCEVCGKSFNDHSNFKYHTLIHKEHKPFTCSICGRGFVQKRGLRKHQESLSCTVPAKRARASAATYQDEVAEVSDPNVSQDVSNVSSAYDDSMNTTENFTAETLRKPTDVVYTTDSYTAETVRASMGLYRVEPEIEGQGRVLDLTALHQVVWAQKQWK